MIFKLLLSLFMIVLCDARVSAKPLVVTTLPEFAYVISEIAKDKVAVKSLLVGTENPHFLDVRPDFISTLRAASMLCFNGLELEIGWLPKSINKSSNSKIKKDTNGWCDLGKQIDAIDKIDGPIDQSMGDVHAAGNPHYNLSIKQMRLVLNFVSEKLTLLVPEEKDFFSKNKTILDQRLKKIDAQITTRINQLKLKNSGRLKVSQYHKEFTYLLRDYSITEGVSIEEKPGISPSAGRIRNVAEELKTSNVDLIIASDDAPISTLMKVSEYSSVPYVILPRGFNTEKNLNSYEKLYSHILKLLASRLKQKIENKASQ